MRSNTWTGVASTAAMVVSAALPASTASRGSASSTGTRCPDATCAQRWAAAARNVTARATYAGAVPSPPRVSRVGGTRAVHGSG